MSYAKRIVDDELAARLGWSGGVVLEGPKASGKTATARQHAASEVLLDTDDNALLSIAADPRLVLDGPTPRLIDEWQLAPKIWNHIRRAIDDRSGPGQFILTGSAVPADDITRHSGAGRLSRMRMRPMSLFESGHSIGTVSLEKMLLGEAIRTTDPGLTITDLATRIAVGGWPGHLGMPPEQALGAARDYLAEIQRADIADVSLGGRNPEKLGRMLRSLARNVGTSASIATLARDTGASEAPIQNNTAIGYLEALERVMVIEDQPAWSPGLRSRARLRSAPKRHFVDPSLAVAALRATPDRLLKDIKFLGFLFESMVIRDLRVYAQACDATVLHYRDSYDLEVDAIVESADGRWAAFEIKLGQSWVDEAAANLLKLATVVKGDPPSFLGVIIGSGYGYMRPDGVAVIPIGALGP